MPAALAAASAGKRRLASPPPHRDAIIDSTAAAPAIRRGAGRIFLALVLGFVAIGLAVVGLTVNTRFAASFGQTAEAAMLLAAIGLTIDLLAIALPSAAAQFWRDRNIMTAAAAWAIWLIALGMTLLAAIGFAATNIGDGVAGRGRLAAEASALTADVTRLRSRARRHRRRTLGGDHRSRDSTRAAGRGRGVEADRRLQRRHAGGVGQRPAPKC